MPLILIFVFALVTTPLIAGSHKPFTVMLDPVGDAHDTGRTIGTSYERGLTLQFCEQLKYMLEDQHQQLRVVLSRFPGEKIKEAFERQNFSNRLQVDLHVAISFYQTNDPAIFVFCYSADATTDAWPLHLPDLAFVPLEQAHRLHFAQTQHHAQQIVETLRKKYSRQSTINGPYALPIADLHGIIGHGIKIEIGIRDDIAWADSLACITHALEELIS